MHLELILHLMALHPQEVAEVVEAEQVIQLVLVDQVAEVLVEIIVILAVQERPIRVLQEAHREVITAPRLILEVAVEAPVLLVLVPLMEGLEEMGALD